MTFQKDGDTVRMMDGKREMGSVQVIDQGEFCSLVDLKLSQGTPSGYGALLGAEGLRACKGKPVYIEVSLENQKAMKFYSKVGFVITHVVMKKEVR